MNNSFEKKNTFVSSALLYAGIGIIVKLMGAVYKIILGGKGFYGELGSAYVAFSYPYYNLLIVISTAGLSSAVAKVISMQQVRGEIQDKENTFKVIKMVMFFVGLFLATVLFFMAPIICEMGKTPEAVYSMRVISISLFFVSMMASYRGYFQGHQNLKPFANSELIEQFLKVSLGLFFAIILLPYGVEYSAAGSLIGVSIGAFVGYMYLVFKKKQFDKLYNLPKPEKLTYKFSVAKIKEILYYAIPIAIGGSMSPIMAMIDSTMIKPSLLYLGYSYDSATRFYSYFSSYSASIMNFPIVLFLAVQISILPVVSSLTVLKDKGKLLSTIRTGLKVSLIFSLASAVGLFVLARPVVSLLWPEPLSIAQNTGHILRYVSLNLIFVSIYQCTAGILQGMGKQILITINLFIGVIVKAISSYYLLKMPELAIMGAVISTILSFMVVAILNIIALKKFVEGDLKIIKLLIKPLISAISMGIIVYFSHSILSSIINSSIATILSVVLGALSYLIILILSGALDKDDLEFMPGKKYLKRFIK